MSDFLILLAFVATGAWYTFMFIRWFREIVKSPDEDEWVRNYENELDEQFKDE